MATTRYPLEALLKSRNWELDALKGQVRSARQAASEDEDAIARLQAEITRAESDVVRESGELIRVERRRLAALFIRERRKQLGDVRERLEAKLGALAKLTDEMAALRRSLRALERHRERYLKTLDERFEKNSEKALEDAWLGGRRARANG